MSALRHIRVLSDGRPGHENQSVGLALALARRTGAMHELVRFAEGAGLRTRLREAARIGSVDLLISAGHATHLPLWWAARRLGAKSVVIMKPSLPRALFDLCLIPRHDLARPEDRGNVITIRGSLNRIGEERSEKTAKGVVLVGGPSAHHGWEAEALARAIRGLVKARPELNWTIADSRRTEAGFVEGLGDLGAEVVPHSTTQPGWLPAQLASASEVWVTEDSVSMIFEAVTAGARVGILPMPVKNPKARTIRAVRELIEAGFARTYDSWLRAPDGWGGSARLHETGRCADAILARWFSDRK